jgi:hypothetical protein
MVITGHLILITIRRPGIDFDFGGELKKYWNHQSKEVLGFKFEQTSVNHIQNLHGTNCKKDRNKGVRIPGVIQIPKQLIVETIILVVLHMIDYKTLDILVVPRLIQIINKSPYQKYFTKSPTFYDIHPSRF